MKRTLRMKRVLSLPLALLLLCSIFTPPAYAGSYSVPKLLITEVTPDTVASNLKSGSPDAFEFIELYNSTAAAVNLKGYRIVYSGKTETVLTITENKSIPAKSTFIVRTLPKGVKADNALFRKNYGVTAAALPDARMTVLTAGGLPNAAATTVSLRAPGTGKTDLCKAVYTKEDVYENIGVEFLYPTDKTAAMRKLDVDKAAAVSPGSVFAGQVPPAKWDSAAPAAPAQLAAVPGEGKITLTWKAGAEADLAFYKIFCDGELVQTVRKNVTKAVFSSLDGVDFFEDEAHTFSMTAVDTSNNVSAKAVVDSYTLTAKVTAESTVTTNLYKYKDFDTRSMAVGLVPGLAQNYVPQGLTYLASENWYILSYYNSDGDTSLLSCVDATTGQFVKSMLIYNIGKVPYTGHASGVAVSKKNLWLASDQYMQRIPLAELISAPNRGRIYIADRFKAPAAGFAIFQNGVLWAGEFYHSPDYLTDESHNRTGSDGKTYHCWASGYKLDEETDTLPAGKIDENTDVVTPDYMLSIPDLIQGATQMPDGSFVFSQSYGRNNDSKVIIFDDLVSKTKNDSTVSINGTEVPMWYFDISKIKATLTTPPMMEGIVAIDNNTIGSIFESGAAKYDSDSCRIDHIYSMSIAY